MQEPLLQKLEDLAGADGTLTYGEFVAAALYDPEHGYYSTARNRVGKEADTDFYTASSLGPLFGRLLAETCVNLLTGQPPDMYTFVEIGAEPGGGVLQGVEHPFGGTTTLRLGDDLKVTGPAIVFANEWLDAQPFHRIIFREGQWRELGLHVRDHQLEETELDTLSPEAQAYLGKLPAQSAEGYRFDLPTGASTALRNLLAQPWHGLFLTLDYGKPLAELLETCPEGTARAYYRHQQTSDLLARPGEQDLTCHLCWDWLDDLLARHGFLDTAVLRQESLFMRHAQATLRAVTEATGNLQEKGRLKELLHPAHLGLKFQALHGSRPASVETPQSAL